MDLVIKFIIAFIKGMTELDLNNLIESSGTLLGQKIKELLKRAILEDEIEPLIDELHADPKTATKIAGILFGSSFNKAVSRISKANTRLQVFLEILNYITIKLSKLKRSIVLKGFLHSSDCYSYWRVENGYAKNLQLFKKNKIYGCIERNMLSPEILIFNEAPNDETLAQINREIRKNPNVSIEALLSKKGRTVVAIYEFKLYFSNGDKVDFEVVELIDLITSLAVALQAQESLDVKPKIKALQAFKQLAET